MENTIFGNKEITEIMGAKIGLYVYVFRFRPWLNIYEYFNLTAYTVSNQTFENWASELTPALGLLYQSSLNSGTVPTDWKEALITPLFTKGDRTAASNYRPVSLTSVISKTVRAYNTFYHHETS